MRLPELDALERTDIQIVRNALLWIEPALRPPPRTAEATWDFLFTSFENTDELRDISTQSVAHEVCNYLSGQYQSFLVRQQAPEDDAGASSS